MRETNILWSCIMLLIVMEIPLFTTKEQNHPHTLRNRELVLKQGRVVIFEGGQYHTAAQPTKGTRCIVNYNLDYYYDDDDEYDD